MLGCVGLSWSGLGLVWIGLSSFGLRLTHESNSFHHILFI